MDHEETTHRRRGGQLCLVHSRPWPVGAGVRHGGGGGGGGSAPAISLSPTSLSFGSQANGTTSAAQTITATNTGTANLFFSNVAESGSFNLDYTIVNDGCIGLTLTPGQSCQTSVTFSPDNTGAMPESIVFTDNAANSPQTVLMTGPAPAPPHRCRSTTSSSPAQAACVTSPTGTRRS